MKKISWEMLQGWGACYSEERLKRWVPEPMTLLELLRLRIPSSHRIWVLHEAIRNREKLGLPEGLAKFTYRGMQSKDADVNFAVLASAKRILLATPSD